MIDLEKSYEDVYGRCIDAGDFWHALEALDALRKMQVEKDQPQEPPKS